MKLVLYSGGEQKINTKLDRDLLRLSGKKDPIMLYIPSDPYELGRYYKEWKKYYKQYGVKNFINFPLPERKLKAQEIQVLMSADIIYLSGGNTFTLLNYIKKSGLGAILKRFSDQGGVLTGLSAGAIVTTPSIHMAAIPTIDADENEEEDLQNWKAMKFVGFEFCPHYEICDERDAELREYSTKRSNPIYACEDGAGIIVEDDKIQFKGKGSIFKFSKGRKTKIIF